MPAVLAEARVIFAEELRRTVRRRSFLLIALSVPALMLLLLVAIPIIRDVSAGEEEPKPTGLVSLSDNVSVDIEGFPGVVLLSSRDEGIAELSQKNIKELFVVPRDYLTSGTVEWVHTGGSPLPGDDSAATLAAILRIGLAAGDLPPEVLGRALVGADFQQVRLGPDGLPIDEDHKAVVGGILVTALSAALLMFAIMLGAGALVQSVAEEKENRMIEVLLTSARPLSVMAAKVLALGTAGLVMILAWVGSVLAIMPLIFSSIPNAPVLDTNPLLVMWVVLFFLAGYFFSAVILAAIGAATSGVKEANQAAAVVILPLIVPVQLLIVIIPNADGLLARTLSFVPFTAPVAMMLRLAFGEPAVLELVASLAIMVVSGMGLLWVSARILRAGLLMYGQRMGLRSALAALTQAG